MVLHPPVELALVFGKFTFACWVVPESSPLDSPQTPDSESSGADRCVVPEANGCGTLRRRKERGQPSANLMAWLAAFIRQGSRAISETLGAISLKYSEQVKSNFIEQKKPQPKSGLSRVTPIAQGCQCVLILP
jgi:hypothetical protein